ncbi:superoxide dismutase family protein [Entomohabitans teleogrylli]|uniref:superoxide dismutase family protein n=1 Tax=Entomohabitans teleogrylli TaxID=1384589 RepID=UPI00073D6C07|nr:superoxide dismutase family protein [Entomohabitans teleogrylli]
MKRLTLAAISLFACAAVQATSKDVEMHVVTGEGIGAAAGHVTISETPEGLMFTPQLKGLPEGEHGFHVHAKGSCESTTVDGKTVAAGAAGGHFDPANTGKHLGPEGDGHLGDLPVLEVNAQGEATKAVTAPRIKKLSEIEGLALMVHAGGDNMSDHPKPLGGGGDRVVCGVIK